jgi:iron-sulfur cluster insertion protein
MPAAADPVPMVMSLLIGSNMITVTEKAQKKIQQLIQEENDPNLILRAFVQGGGCSGFQYGFSFENNTEPDDFIIKCGGVKIAVDPISMQYLRNAELDYKSSIFSSEFILKNPNASSSCGCGKSFTI